MTYQRLETKIPLRHTPEGTNFLRKKIEDFLPTYLFLIAQERNWHLNHVCAKHNQVAKASTGRSLCLSG